MAEIICFRLLDVESPAAPLAGAVRDVNAGQCSASVFTLDSISFSKVPNAPFAYWVAEEVRSAFDEISALEGDNVMARSGLCTGDDFRFVRCWWEVATSQPDRPDYSRWHAFAKGGAYSPFYSDLHLVVDWANHGKDMMPLPGSSVKNVPYFFQHGITWPLRTTSGLSFRAMPSGAIFGHKGPSVFFKNNEPLNYWATLSLMQSRCFAYLVGMQLAAADSAARSYEVGVIQRTPLPCLSDYRQCSQLGEASLAIWLNKRNLDTFQEVSHVFVAPWTGGRLPALVECEADLASAVSDLEAMVSGQMVSIDRLASEVYGFEVPEAPLVESDGTGDGDEEDGTDGNQDFARKLVSYLVGITFGRWVMAANDYELRKAPADPFSPLPAKAPGAAPVETAKLYFAEDASAESPLLNSSRIALRQATGLASVDGYEQDLAARLGVPSLRDYLSRPAGFFADHLSVYSKSRRKAPIYWPLSTRSGEFILWIYYPKLDADSLPRLITEVLDPRLRSLNEEIASLVGEGRTAGRRGKLEALRLELSEMRQDFQELIAKGYKPDLNDGVLLTACPLAKYFRHAGFRAKLEACWRELARGDYDWSHLAMSMWPERVVAACKQDRSIAIAHGREDLCPGEPLKATRGRKKKAA